MKLEDSFDIEDQFTFYLEKCQVSKESLSKVQYTEMKKAFFAGFGQSLLVMLEKISKIEPEMDAVEVIEAMNNQVLKFFKNEAFKFNN